MSNSRLPTLLESHYNTPEYPRSFVSHLGKNHAITTHKVRILGLDPGLQTTGWGILDIQGTSLLYVAHGQASSTRTQSLAKRLSDLYTQLCAVIEIYTPHEAAVEEMFVNKNPTSTLKLGMARGIALLAPAQAKMNVYEYSANQVKKAVVGAGHAEKNQVAMMVQILLPKVGPVAKDAADALAIAICHGHSRNRPHAHLFPF